MIKTFFLSILIPAFSCAPLQPPMNGSTATVNTPYQSQVVEGLKEALSIGTQNATTRLSALDGFFANAAIKILMPPEAAGVEKTLRRFGMGNLVDKTILSLNRAAEDATKSALPIFVDAIKQMTINDAVGILKGGDSAATIYFKQKTTPALTAAFSPVIKNSLDKVDATKYWSQTFTVYNQFSAKQVNTDLPAYVTQRAIDGIFHEVALEEQKIRKDPAARVTDILKQVFGQ